MERPNWLRLDTAVAGVLGIALVVLGLWASPASAAEATDRVQGGSRAETAARVAKQTYQDGAETAVIARQRAFPDALAGSSLAGLANAPVLLTDREMLSDPTASALEELGVSNVILLGGEQAIAPTVAAELEANGYNTSRRSGDLGEGRAGTAATIAREVNGNIGTLNGERVVFVANGGQFPDALVAGPVAFANRNPIVLASQEGLPDPTAEALSAIAPDRAILLGGDAVLSEQVVNEINALGIPTGRLAGRDRTDTAAAFADFALDAAGFDTETLFLTRGDDFPDALAAAPYAGSLQAPIMLTRSPDRLSYDLLQWTVDHSDRANQLVRAIGGEQALSPRVLRRVAESAVAPDRGYTYQLGVRGDVESDVRYFAEHVDWTFTDQRGWSLDNDLRFSPAREGADADFNIYLASPQAVANAAPVCSAQYSCTVGNDVYINDERWENATPSFSARTLSEYRHYVVLHEMGHAFDLDHANCPAAGEPAPVMQQQSISLEGCESQVWPLPYELDAVRDRTLGSGSAGMSSTPESSTATRK
jgi:putative cell wall-binding protein